jgi:hypothetical protein
MAWIKTLMVKLQATKAVLLAGGIVPVRKLTLWHVLFAPERYAGVVDDLGKLPVPLVLRVGRRTMAVPQDLEEFSAGICYGQKLYLLTEEPFAVGVILRYVAGYFYPIYTGKRWDESKALLFGKKVLSSSVVTLYPVAIHLVSLMEQLAKREQTLLHREPTQEERAAGVETLNKFAALTSLIFLQEQFHCTPEQVMLLPYDDCLVRFMLAKEEGAYRERLMAIMNKPKTATK